MYKTISVVVIGNEVLRGKVSELNANHVIKESNKKYIRIKSIHIVMDRIKDIVNALKIATTASYVITSGGIGPTCDDITFKAIAKFANKKLYKDKIYLEKLKELFGDSFNKNIIKMAYIPQGSKLIMDKEGILPIVQFKNIFVLPGEPSFFKKKLEVCMKVIGRGSFIVKEFRVHKKEEEMAQTLKNIQKNYRDVFIGSYPDYKNGYVDICVEGENKNRVNRVVKELKRNL